MENIIEIVQHVIKIKVTYCLNIYNEVVEVKLRVSQMIHKTICLCLFTKFLFTSKVVKVICVHSMLVTGNVAACNLL